MATPHSADELAERIARLEEAAAFAQHESEQLSDEVATLGRRLLELSRRLEAMEQREAARRAGEAEPTDAE